MHKRLVHKNQIFAIAVVSLISTILLSVGFAATVNVTAQPGSMATLQNIPATYAVSIVPADILTKGSCCFNQIIGLPTKNGHDQPFFDYEKQLFDVLQQYKHIWIKKATGLGIRVHASIYSMALELGKYTNICKVEIPVSEGLKSTYIELNPD